MLELVEFRRTEIDGQTEASRQGELLVDRVSPMLVVESVSVPVLEAFPHQVAAVAGGIDQNVGGLLLQAALDHRLQILVLSFEFLEAQIVHIYNEAVVASLDLADHVVQVPELVAVDLDDPKAPVKVLVGDGLNGGGLAGPRFSVEEDVVGVPALYEGLCVFHQPGLSRLVADQIVQMHMEDVLDGNDPGPVALFGHDPEGLVEAEPAHAVFPVELGDGVLHFLRAACGFQLYGKLTDPVTDPAVVDLALLRAGLKVKEQ